MELDFKFQGGMTSPRSMSKTTNTQEENIDYI